MFAEDRAMNDVLHPLIERVARELRLDVSIRVRCSGGGHGKALDELTAFQRLVQGGQPGFSPGVLVVGRDANCRGYTAAQREVRDRIAVTAFAGIAIASPDPHVERWLMADPESFHAVVGSTPVLGPGKCERDFYKTRLAEAVLRGENPPTLRGIEFAADLVEAMDLYRAGQNDPSLGNFIEQLRGALGPLRPR